MRRIHRRGKQEREEDAEKQGIGMTTPNQSNVRNRGYKDLFHRGPRPPLNVKERNYTCKESASRDL